MISLSSVIAKNLIDSLDISHHTHLEFSSADFESSNTGSSHDDEQCSLHHCHSNQHLTTNSFLISDNSKSILFLLNNLISYTSPLYSFSRPPISF